MATEARHRVTDGSSDGRVLAKPPVRRLARALGVDLTAVRPTGAGGVVTREDVESASVTATRPVPPTVTGAGHPVAAATADPDPAAGGPSARGLPTLDGPQGTPTVDRGQGRLTLDGPQGRPTADRRIPVRGVRRATADAMVTSAFTAPHVSVWVRVDVTRSVRLLDRLRADPEFAGLSTSPLLLAARAVVLAAGRHPEVNASWIDYGAAGSEIVLRHRINLGIAVSTSRGLVVPNIKDAARLSLRDLAAAVADLSRTAREGRTTPEDLTGGTFSITNIGVFGMDGGTPILNPGEAAILCLGRVHRMPWVHGGRVRPRWVTELTLSFDHRVVDGDVASAFLSDVAAVLADPTVGYLRS